MAEYKVKEHKTIPKSIKKFPKHFHEKYSEWKKDAAKDPVSSTVMEGRMENMKGAEGNKLYKARIGGYRIVYDIVESQLLVLIVTVDKRGDVYKKKHRK